MKNGRPSSPANITLNALDGIPIYRQIANQVKYSVASGRLCEGDALPAIRTLAVRLKVSPNTVVQAYRELEVAGIVQKRQGNGTFISIELPPASAEERRRAIEQRIDILLSEARQLRVPADVVVRWLWERESILYGQGTIHEPT